MRGLNIHTQTHKRNRLLGFFFFFFFYILDILNLKKNFFVLIFECRWVGNVYSYLRRFLPFQSFFFLCFFRFLFPSFLFSLLAGSLLHFFFLSSSSARFPTPSSLDPFLFFSSGLFSSWSTAPL